MFGVVACEKMIKLPARKVGFYNRAGPQLEEGGMWGLISVRTQWLSPGGEACQEPSVTISDLPASTQTAAWATPCVASQGSQS